MVNLKAWFTPKGKIKWAVLVGGVVIAAGIIVGDFVSGFTASNKQNMVTLTWENQIPQGQRHLYCGERHVGALKKGADSFTYQEDEYGLFQYVIQVEFGGLLVDEEMVELALGELKWNHSRTPGVEGYHVRVFQEDPEVNPQAAHILVDVGYVTEYSLDQLLIQSGEYWITASSYKGEKVSIQTDTQHVVWIQMGEQPCISM